ncbi:MAG: transketolase [Oscillospiraceae bacterium]|nr:transketolase [Oscillospiraceae bacterium]
MNEIELKEECKKVRRHIVGMIGEAGSGHPGGSLSMVEILVALYFRQMRIDPKNPKDPGRDRFVLSKGHAAPCLYAVLAERGFFDTAELMTLRKLHSPLQGHPDAKKCPGVEASTGSLGQGISIACGMALGAKLSGNGANVYTVCGDGEMQEGLVWEAAEAAAHYRLDNLTVIVDHNGLQIDGCNCDVMDVRDLGLKFQAFGFDIVRVKDGNDIGQVLEALAKPAAPGKPKMILADTVKGKGVSFMENQAGWHGKAPNSEQCAQALSELEALI